MEEKKELIGRYLRERKLSEECLKKRQMADLELIYDTAEEMRKTARENELTVKNVSDRTQKKVAGGHSISLATYYNNGKLLYDFVNFLKSTEGDKELEDLLSETQAELAKVKEINSALIRRDIKFEEMQAEIDALRSELKIVQRPQKQNSKEVNKSPHSTDIPDIGIFSHLPSEAKS